MPTEQTKAEYRRLAANFYEKRLGDEPPSPKRITDALKACAGEYRPAYWRRLRCALVLDQQEKGYKAAAERIQGTINPMTTDQHGPLDKGLRGPVPPKQRRAKSISETDNARLQQTLLKRCAESEGAERQRHWETFGAVLLAERLGVRPAEMPHLRVDLERGVVNVQGAKKSGVRGADRELTLPDDAQSRQAIAKAARLMREAGPKGIHRIQARLDRLSRELWPRRQARPSLYTYRHQLGANLKAMRLDRRAIAYIMGHQSTQSVEVYGDRRRVSGGIGIKLTGHEAERFQGRENHHAPHSGPADRTACGPETPSNPVQQEGSQPPPSAPSSGPSGPGM